MSPHPTPAAAAAALAVLCAGCGGVTGGRVDPGYPAQPTRVSHAADLQTRLQGNLVRFAVPTGWGLARIDKQNARPAFVRLDGDCYLSIAITGSSTQTLTPAQLAQQYSHASGDYTWRLSRLGRVTLALLGNQNTSTGAVSRSSLGTVYVPTSAGKYLAIDFGAGVWPLHGHACPDDAVAGRLPALSAAGQQIFSGAQIVPRDEASESEPQPTGAT
jgi:hypothetical protein